MFIKLVRLGSDAQLNYLPSGSAVVNLSVAYDVGYGERKKTQWLKLAYFGERASKTVDMLTKGKSIVAYVDDLHLDTFDGQNGPVTSLKGTLIRFEFAGGDRQQGGADSGAAHATASSQAPRQPARSAPAPAPAGADFEDDIPF